jgi:phosphatidylserine/phosphatidylglycerophosphate/cardiolipin synthase-like enzyme
LDAAHRRHGPALQLSAPIEFTPVDPGGRAEAMADRVAAFLGEARETLELALYDVRLPGPVGDTVREAIEGAAKRGVKVRLAYNLERAPDQRVPLPPPPSTEPDLIESLSVPTVGIPGFRDLMHHKYVVRDGRDVWTGSLNWTQDAWTLQENVVVTAADPALASAFRANFEELWSEREVENSGDQRPDPVDVAGTEVRPWFTPGKGRALSHRIADAIGAASSRVRIASPVITAGPVLGTLAQEVAEGRIDVAGVVDMPQCSQVFSQWRSNGQSAWKIPLLAKVLDDGEFAGKPSTPYAPGAVHDYMHAKVTVCDDVVFAGSFNLSRSGEMNAENVLEIHSAEHADAMAAFIDEVRGRYPEAVVPQG